MTEAVDILRPLLAALAGGLTARFLAAAAARAMPNHKGWRQIRPSAMHWTGFVLGAGLTSLFLYIRLFVGSSRPDADYQMKVLGWLIASFAFGTLLCGVQMARIF